MTPTLSANRHRLDVLQARLGLNVTDDMLADRAAENLDAGLPAYFRTSSYSNAIACNLCHFANIHGGIVEGWRGYQQAFHCIIDARYESVETFDTLIPLNEAAVADMARVARVIGSFDREPELRRRAERAGWHIEAAAVARAA